MSAYVKTSALAADAWRIAPTDTNYFALLFDPARDGLDPVAVVEIFAVGGATPPNTHTAAHEFFYVLSGEGIATCGDATTPLRRGDALLVRPGQEHIIANTGTAKLYTLTVMAPDEGFAALLRSGERVTLDAEDRAVLGAPSPPFARNRATTTAKVGPCVICGAQASASQTRCANSACNATTAPPLAKAPRLPVSR